MCAQEGVETLARDSTVLDQVLDQVPEYSTLLDPTAEPIWTCTTVPSSGAKRIKQMYTTLTNANPVWARLLTAHKVLIMTHANTAFREYTVRGVGDPGVVVAAIECALEEWNTVRDGGDGDDVEWNRDDDTLRVRSTALFAYEKPWALLTKPQVGACEALGWCKKTWDGTREPGQSQFNTPLWLRLSEQQQNSCLALGYTDDTWNEYGSVPDGEADDRILGCDTHEVLPADNSHVRLVSQ